ncbi:MAG: 50S ribosomal protein L17 [Desulfobacteraceae bacterium]|uniref:Large ribosomal subunit protein bL17 n=1 Tax=Candidatus Desulfaltia bathyphila TaxID=2841697 RepID=A0A8J6N3U3_9BACT|nr:50S ribosomal protein L17 [Candidatus Desulfaltia bathyphila]
MRHRKAGLKLNRTSSHRNAMFRNMVTSLFKHERIRTTDTKAKGLRHWADHLITLAKRGDLHARRQALSIVREKKVVYKLFDEAAERFGSISGGYTRIIKMGRRSGDAAPVSMIELVGAEKSEKKKTKDKKAAGAGKKKTTEKKAAGAGKKKTAEKKVAEAGKKKTAEKKVVETGKKKTAEKKQAVDKKEDKSV